jgi:hypothetical protein
MPRKLQDIDIEEISLVESPANKKKFAIIKHQRRKLMDEFITLLREFLGSADPGATEAIEKAARALPEASVTKMDAALKALAPLMEDMPDTVQASVRQLAELASTPVIVEKMDLDAVPIEKVGARLSKATLEELKKIQADLVAALKQLPVLKKVMSALESIIGSAAQVSEPDEDKDKGDVKKQEDKTMLTDQERAELERLRAEERTRIEKAEKEAKDAAENRIKKLEETVELLAKSRGVRTSLPADDKSGDKATTDVKDPFPSIDPGFFFGMKGN